MTSIIAPNAKFTGWYDAPFPFGKTEFSLLIESCGPDGEFSGSGQDKQGEFTVKGNVEGQKVVFVKDYKDRKYTDIKYDGLLDGDHIEGQYSFLYKTLVINMNVKEKFYMKLSN